MSQLDLEFNPITGSFDVIDKQDHHGGYWWIPAGRTIVVDNYKNMIVHGYQILDGSLIVQENGLLSIIG